MLTQTKQSGDNMNWLDIIKNLRLPALKGGSHTSPADGLCAMEMVAYMERLPHSDKPECTCPVIAAYVRGINDAMKNTERQALLPYLPRLVGTVSPEHERARGEYLAWAAIRKFAPLALRAAGLESHAVALESATDFRSAQEAANAAAYAAAAYTAYAAANAAYAAANAAYAAYAGLFTTLGRLDAAYTANAAANAAKAAAYAAPFSTALQVLDEVLLIGPARPARWSEKTARELCTLRS